MIRISLLEAEYIAHALAKELWGFDEPMPPFATRFPGKLESCLGQPFATFDNRKLYPGITTKAAILLYLVIKNHPFENGNKRMAVALMLVFLHKNGKWLNIDPVELYNIACTVAESDPRSRNVVTEQLQSSIKQHLIDLYRSNS